MLEILWQAFGSCLRPFGALNVDQRTIFWKEQDSLNYVYFTYTLLMPKVIYLTNKWQWQLGILTAKIIPSPGLCDSPTEMWSRKCAVHPLFSPVQVMPHDFIISLANLPYSYKSGVQPVYIFIESYPLQLIGGNNLWICFLWFKWLHKESRRLEQAPSLKSCTYWQKFLC